MNYTRYALSIALLFSGVIIANENINLAEDNQEVTYVNTQETDKPAISFVFILKDVDNTVISEQSITVTEHAAINLVFEKNQNEVTNIFKLTTIPSIQDEDTIIQDITYSSINNPEVIKRSLPTKNKDVTSIVLSDDLILEVYTEHV